FMALPKRILLGPALSFCALLVLSFAKKDGYPLFHLTGGMQLSWLVITLLVMMIIMMQNPAIRQQSRGVVYMEVGSIAGLAVGLLGFSLTSNMSLLYALAVIGIALGIFLGFLMFTNTPDGRDVSIPSGRFFKYLLAKGFPVLVTAAQLSIPAVILIAAAGDL
ncbi:MAG: hypothetical protein K2J15_05965, partial [Muribaculaceae bacterium]|nr:hypothetical protein [Muribaculaceae bacterium]